MTTFCKINVQDELIHFIKTENHAPIYSSAPNNYLYNFLSKFIFNLNIMRLPYLDIVLKITAFDLGAVLYSSFNSL